MLVEFCREKDVVFILDEVQSNFGRTGAMYAFEEYGVEPDLVVLGKGLGNGVPVNCVAGRADVFAGMHYGGGSDTWSAHPLGCAATLATLDVFESEDVVETARRASAVVKAGLLRLSELAMVTAVRGEGMVWGVELGDAGPNWPSAKVAAECVRACYVGDRYGDAIHFLGPLAGNVLRVSPPLTMTVAEAERWMAVMYRLFAEVDAAIRQAA
jgi:4-aminobutyrate aminotransferase-like enzyme